MKKLFLGMLAILAMIATSCQQEVDLGVGSVGETATVSINVGTPTRAYSDGATATVLQYAVYDANGNELTDLTVTDGEIHGSTTVKLQLVTGNTYTVIFWAAAPNAPYGVDFANKTMTVDYTGAVSSDENRDAFYAHKTFEVKGAQTETIELRRPFAQLNIGTNDYTAATSAGYTVSHAKVATQAYTTLDLLNDTVDVLTDVEFGYAAIPTNEEFPVEDYQYMAMNYLLVNTQENIEVVFTYATDVQGANAKTRTVGSVPVQRNHRTNLYGSLLTSDVAVNVEIKPAYETPDNLVYVWDGSEVSEPQVSAENPNIYEIEVASELAWLAGAVNGTLDDEYTRSVAANDFAGKTFRLTKDVDLGGKEWTPIGSTGKIFKGTFDGQGHVVKNLVITGYNSNVGLFGVTHDGEIKNLVVENAKVSGRLNVGVVAGEPYTSKYTNITVKGLVEVNGMAYVGGVGGKNAYADWTNVKVEADAESYVKAVSIENGNAYRTYVGGVVGFNGEGGHKFTNITSNINVEGSTCDVGGLFGIAHYGNQFVNCRCTGNVKITTDELENALEMGGIAGVWHNGGENVVLTDCSFTGNLSAPNVEGVAFYYDGLVGCPYSATGNGKLIIDGKHYVASATELQAALNAATGETTLYLGANIVGDVTVVQKQGVKVTIEGKGKKYNGSIKVHSNSNYYADAALTIKSVNFETSVASVNVIEALENGSQRYSNNITVENCTFTATGEAVNTSVAVQVKATRGVTVKDCTATGLHSLIQAQSCDTGDVKVIGCTVNGKNGVAFKQVKAATVEGTTITALEYGIRFDGNIDNYGIVVKNNNVTAVQPLIVRKMTGKNNTIALEGNTLTTEADYQVVVTNGSDDEAYVKPTGTYELTGADAYTVFPAPFSVASWDEFTAALAAGEDNIKLTADITFDANYQLQKAVTLNLGGYSMTLPMINIHTKTTIKNGTINGKVYARKNAEIVFDNVKFSGAVADNLSTEGHLAIQGGCKSLYAKNCLFSPTSVSGSQTKPLSFEGGSTIMKFEGCEFKSSPYKKQVYLNSLSAAGSLEFVNCNFNNKTPNIMFAAACPLTNLKMSGTTKLGSVTLETNRAKEAVTAEDLAYLRESLIANNSMSSVRLFYAGGSSEYIR